MVGFRTGDSGIPVASLRSLVLVRIAVVSVICGIGIGILYGKEGVSTRPLLSLLLVTLSLSAIYWAAARSSWKPRAQAACQLVVDVGLASGLIHYTGGVTSPFALLYVLIISAASGFFLMRGTLALAALCTAAYGLLLGAHENDLFSSGEVMTPTGPDPASVVALQVTLYGATFLALAVLSGLLSIRVYRKGVDLATMRSRLRQANLDTDKIVRSMSSGLITIDRSGRIAHFNPAGEEICGMRAQSLIGKNFQSAFREKSDGLTSMVGGIMGGGNDLVRREMVFRSTDRGIVPIGVSASALRDSEGEVAGVVVIFQDLTEVRKMQERVRHADRLAAIGELSAGIAHEIRNPLATISGSIQLLEADLPVEGEQVRLLGLIVKESDRLHRIVEDFLDFARSKPIGYVRVNVSSMLEEIVRLLENHPKRSSDVAITIDADEPGIQIRADDEQIRRVFINLAVNALEEMPDSGELNIGINKTTMASDDPSQDPISAVAIRFSDSGCGVPVGAMEELFRPFFTTKKGGTGLGLAMAQKIVLSHNGRIDVDSGPAGTTFTVFLPWDGVTAGEECLV